MPARLVTAACLIAAVTSLGAARGATYLPIPSVKGAVQTEPYAINNLNIITGGWYDANGVEHGFVGPLVGSYLTFDYSGAGVLGTEARGINDLGTVVGWANNENFVEGDQFVRDPTGKMTTVTKNGAPLDGILQGVNDLDGGALVGDYWIYTPLTRLAYLAQQGAWKRNFVLPFDSTREAARGINNLGTVVGLFRGAVDGNLHGFILQNGRATQVDYPNPAATQTYLEGINDIGLATGSWTDTAGDNHAFMLDTITNTYTPIVPPGSYANAQAFGVNDLGAIVVGTDATAGPANFVYFAYGGGYGYGTGLITVGDSPSVHLTGGSFQPAPRPRSLTGDQPVKTKAQSPGARQP